MCVGEGRRIVWGEEDSVWEREGREERSRGVCKIVKH